MGWHHQPPETSALSLSVPTTAERALVDILADRIFTATVAFRSRDGTVTIAAAVPTRENEPATNALAAAETDPVMASTATADTLVAACTEPASDTVPEAIAEAPAVVVPAIARDPFAAMAA